jgi:predicted AAA+ superfamily ATPase
MATKPQADPPNDMSPLLARAERVLAQLEAWLPPAPPPIAWDEAIAFRWRKRVHGRDGSGGYLEAVRHVHRITLADLQGIDRQKKIVEVNTRQFLAGAPANNVLMTGSRGTGKSSLVKALLQKYAKQKLRVIEVDKDDLVDLPAIVDLIAERPEKFIVFCDDLSFDAGEGGYKALKVILDGTVAAASSNLLIYATSNRRHLLPEYFSENLETRHVGEEVHPGESVEEKVSLSERFGLWVSFYPFSQDEYFAAVKSWLRHFGFPPEAFDALREEAVQWGLSRGSRSGRVAWQFARDQAGRRALR